jgi:secondary thiamine-phosphate synthase enzyme
MRTDEEDKMYTSKLSIETVYMGMHDITAPVADAVKKGGAVNGICHISMLHSTAGLMICAKSAVAQADIMREIEMAVPTRVDFKHRETASDAGGHVKTAFAGSQISLPLQDGRLLLGEEQAVVFAEFDGPRPRNIIVTVYAD